MNYWACTVITGVGATLVIDLWGLVRKLLFDIPAPDYRLVGRWLATMVDGRFRHDSIATVLPVRREWGIGWTAHYLIGVAFAATLLGCYGLEWIQHPTLGPALIVGIGSVTAPFLIMQPAMGAGIAASRTPNPAAARLQSLITHGMFGMGLYLTGWVVNVLLSI